MYLIFIASLFRIVQSDVVNTSSGPVRGVSSLSEDVEAFLSIPYAEPPVGELRFAKPVPKKWTQVLNASEMPPPCPQIDIGKYYFLPDLTNMNEDCLYLNIWAPRSRPVGKLRPVVIHIHPGAFAVGSSNMKVYDGSFFASRGDLVAASMNYRLGSAGYFYSGNELVGGNMGMYDQIMAIKWLKENAKQFGGDPDNIVLQGFSAGSVSINAHMVSPLSMNLFNRVILHSASMAHPFFFDDNAKLRKNSQAFASLLGCSNQTITLENDPESVVECLKSKPIEDLIAAEKTLSNTNAVVFFPRVKDEFLPTITTDALREGKFRKDVDVLIGFTKNEGTLTLLVGFPDYVGPDGKALDELKKNLAYGILRLGFSLVGLRNSTEYIERYMSPLEEPKSDGYIGVVANLFGDYTISCGQVFFADFVSLKGNPVYFYIFDFRAASTPNADWVGVTHLDDVQYVFGIPYHDNFTAEEIELSHRMMDRWASFAWTGNPNIKDQVPWLRYNYHNPVYLNFGQKEESIRLRPNDRCEIWREEFKSEIDPELIERLQKSE